MKSRHMEPKRQAKGPITSARQATERAQASFTVARGSWRRSVGNDTSDTNFGKTNCYQFGEHIKGTGDHRHKDCSAGH